MVGEQRRLSKTAENVETIVQVAERARTNISNSTSSDRNSSTRGCSKLLEFLFSSSHLKVQRLCKTLRTKYVQDNKIDCFLLEHF